MKTVSFSVSEGEHAVFVLEARCKGLTVSQYCKMAAFSHLAKYASKGLIADIVKLLDSGKIVAPGPTDVGSWGSL